MEQAEFKAFYARTSKPLWAYIYRICGDGHLTDDLHQESYLRFLQKPPRDTGESRIRSYLYTIATRLNIDRWKRVKVHEKWRLNFAEKKNGKFENLDETVGLQTDMAGVFSELKPQERALLWLAYVEEHSHRSIGEILGLKEKGVRVALFRARKKLAKILSKKGIDAEVLT